MAWVKLDDGFVEHERIDPLSDKAFRLHLTALCMCARKLTDGYVSAKDVKVSRTICGAAAKHVDELVATGVWLSTGNGTYAIRDYLQYNPSAEQVREERRKAAERMRNRRNGAGE